MHQPSTESMGLFMGSGRRPVWMVWTLLAAGLTATALAVWLAQTAVDAEARREFEFVCREIRSRIQDRLAAHERILRSGAAFLGSAGSVNRQSWRQFTERQHVQQQLPGIQGIGYAALIPSQTLARHVQAIRAEGFPEYQVRPQGDRDPCTSIIYLEPFTNRNLRAFGYDMFSEPVRRAAMERARDSDAAALSGKVILVQETDQDVQAGTLMYVPVYRADAPHATPAQRRQALVGWVYSPYRMADLMQGILGGWAQAGARRVRLEVFDGPRAAPEALLYDSLPAGAPSPAPASRLAGQLSVLSAGRQWTLRFTPSPSAFFAPDSSKAWLVLFGGTSTSLLMSGLLFSLVNTRSQARCMASQMTAELRQSEEKYRVIFNNELYAICIFDMQTMRLLDVNDAFARLYGYSRPEILAGMTVHDFTAEPEASGAATTQAVREGTIFIPLRYHRKRGGAVFPVEIVGGPYTWQGKRVMFGLIHDITERQQAHEVLQRSARDSELIRNYILAINACPDLDSALACLVDNAIALGGVDSGAAYLIEGDTAVLRCQRGLAPEFAAQVACRPVSTDYVQAALGRPRELLAVAELYPERRQLGERYGLRHVYCIGLAAGPAPFGLLQVASRSPRAPSPAALELIRILAVETESLFVRLGVEERLRRITAEQRVILDSAPAGISRVRNRKVEWANAAHDALLGYDLAETAGLETSRFFARAAQYDQVGSEGCDQMAKGGSYTAEVQLKRKDGSVVECRVAGRAVNAADLAEGGIWVVQDITQQKQAEAAVQASLREKESLLKEVHHRVKNNLQIISSLLRLQAGRVEHPAARAVLTDMQNRIRSMALIHEHLYRSKTLAQVDLSSYLTQLCTQLFHALAAPSGAVQLKFALAPVSVEADQAIPCGLLVSELVSNSLKHAFPEGRAGEVRVELQPVPGGEEFCLRVADNGIGLPSGLDPARLTSLGLRLAPDLARQLGGQLVIVPGPGAGFEVVFTLKL